MDTTTTTIIKRIVANHEAYKVELVTWIWYLFNFKVYFYVLSDGILLLFLQKRNDKKVESEKKYYEGKTYISGD